MKRRKTGRPKLPTKVLFVNHEITISVTPTGDAIGLNIIGQAAENAPLEPIELILKAEMAMVLTLMLGSLATKHGWPIPDGPIDEDTIQ